LTLLRAWRDLPVMEPAGVRAQAAAGGGVAGTGALTGDLWRTLAARAGRSDGAASPGTPSRFRLLGTYFVNDGTAAPRGKAILDDAVSRREHILGEGDEVDGVRIAAVFRDHVTLQSAGGVRDLWIEFASRARIVEPAATPSNGLAGASAVATNRFGCVPTQENRWEFTRQPLLDYYQELLDEPERLAAIFDTMKPVRDERNRITGYVVGIEGEKEFFDAVGLKQGDIVRSVNSVAMTNRKRAEFFIDEFLKDRMTAVVLEVERGGQMVKQVYQLRQ
jgi:type II secretory pathway component PulC